MSHPRGRRAWVRWWPGAILFVAVLVGGCSEQPPRPALVPVDSIELSSLSSPACIPAPPPHGWTPPKRTASTDHDWDSDGVPDSTDNANALSEARWWASPDDHVEFPEPLRANDTVLILEPRHQEAYVVLAARRLPDPQADLVGWDDTRAVEPPFVAVVATPHVLELVASIHCEAAAAALSTVLSNTPTVHFVVVAPDVAGTSVALEWDSLPPSDGTWLVVRSNPDRPATLHVGGPAGTRPLALRPPQAALAPTLGGSLWRWEFVSIHANALACFEQTSRWDFDHACPSRAILLPLRAYGDLAASGLQEAYAALDAGLTPVAFCIGGLECDLDFAPVHGPPVAAANSTPSSTRGPEPNSAAGSVDHVEVSFGADRASISWVADEAAARRATVEVVSIEGWRASSTRPQLRDGRHFAEAIRLAGDTTYHLQIWSWVTHADANGRLYSQPIMLHQEDVHTSDVPLAVEGLMVKLDRGSTPTSTPCIWFTFNTTGPAKMYVAGYWNGAQEKGSITPSTPDTQGSFRFGACRSEGFGSGPHEAYVILRTTRGETLASDRVLVA